jgi:hypothetical protein
LCKPSFTTEYRKTDGQLLGFSYDFGITVTCHQNADAIVLAIALERHSPGVENIADHGTIGTRKFFKLAERKKGRKKRGKKEKKEKKEKE